MRFTDITGYSLTYTEREWELTSQMAYILLFTESYSLPVNTMSDIGLIIGGIILAVFGYLLNTKTTGILSTVGLILLWLGVLIAIIGVVLLVLSLAGVSLLVLPMLA